MLSVWSSQTTSFCNVNAQIAEFWSTFSTWLMVIFSGTFDSKDAFCYDSLLHWKPGLLHGTTWCIENMHKFKYFQKWISQQTNASLKLAKNSPRQVLKRLLGCFIANISNTGKYGKPETHKTKRAEWSQ